jgi:hypothetical protein
MKLDLRNNAKAARGIRHVRNACDETNGTHISTLKVSVVMKSTVMKVFAVVSLMAVAIAGLGISVAAAQADVSVAGRVLWVAAGRMVVAPYAAAPGVSVDLSRANLDNYSALQTGDSVVVTGSVAPEGDRLIGTSIRHLAGP